MNTLIEYMKLHILSLEQDYDEARDAVEIPDDEYFESDDYYRGAIEATKHLLETAMGLNNDN